jgi:hypothetical protein
MQRKMSDLRPLAIVIGIVLMTSLLCGCVGEGNGGTHGTVTWVRPTQVRVEGVSPVEAASAVNISLRLYDGENHVSQWDVQLRLIAQDSLGFVMLNISMPIKAKDFTTKTVDNVIDTWYNTSIPFVAFKKSSDKVLGILTGRMMTVYAWITYEGTTYKQSPAPLLINMAVIPHALLVPNVAPSAAIYGPPTAWEGDEVSFDAGNSTDDSGFDGLSFAWDWGDGNTTTYFADEHESHSYPRDGVYTVNVTVTDGEGASDAAFFNVTIEDPMRVTIYQSNVVIDPGTHFGDTYVAVKLQNVGPVAIGLAGFSPRLRNMAGAEVKDNGTQDDLPAVLGVATTVSVVFYFDTPDGFVATYLRVGEDLHPMP